MHMRTHGFTKIEQRNGMKIISYGENSRLVIEFYSITLD